MPQAIPKLEPIADACRCSFDRKHELRWDEIEMEIHCISARVMAVEMIGRGAQEDVHGQKLGHVFDMLTSHLYGDVERLKELLGLSREVGP
jgi:hypothetical protein